VVESIGWVNLDRQGNSQERTAACERRKDIKWMELNAKFSFVWRLENSKKQTIRMLPLQKDPYGRPNCAGLIVTSFRRSFIDEYSVEG
jgi:hypothetical protein